MTGDVRELGKNVFWNGIVITCADPKWRNAIDKEVKTLSRANLLPPHNLLLVIEDPQFSFLSNVNNSDTVGVGSGGATLNALLVVAERLSALAGDTTISSDNFSKNLVLVIHFGRNSYHYCGGSAFLPVTPSSAWIPSSCVSPQSSILLQNSIWLASVLASTSTSGVWITSLDFFIPFAPTISLPSSKCFGKALVCSLRPSSLLYISGPHGRLYCNPEGRLEEIVHQTIPRVYGGDCGGARIVCGPTYLPPSLAERILALYTLPPLDRCTYYGTDSTSEPVQISLYFDLLLPLCGLTEKQRYLSGELSSSYAKKAKYSTLRHQEGLRARHNIWNQVRPYAVFEHPLDIDGSIYLSQSLSFSATLEPLIKCMFPASSESSLEQQSIYNCNSLLKCTFGSVLPRQFTVINSYLGHGVCLGTVDDCVLFDLHIPKENIVLNFGSRMVWQGWPLFVCNASDEVASYNATCITCHGYDDHLSLERTCEEFSIFNKSWADFSLWWNVSPEEIWRGADAQIFPKAKLFPFDSSLEEQLLILTVMAGGSSVSSVEKVSSVSSVEKENIISMWKRRERKSLEDVHALRDVQRLLSAREDTFMKRVESIVEETSQQVIGPPFIPIFKYVTAISDERVASLLHSFHRVLENSPSAASRLLANIADLLGCLGGPIGGLRSGPAANREWVPALRALKAGKFREGVRMLELVCLKFIATHRPDDIIRASRHYERASHILIGKQVETSREQVFPLERQLFPSYLVPKDAWVEAACPARLDLAGGWTDTPPVCYELGGAVLNVAIKINGEKPLGTKARITSSLDITCVLQDQEGTNVTLVWKSLDDFKDYDNPVSPGALIKACLAYTNFVDIEDESSTLEEQLKDRYGGGLELIVWSQLAHGSGLGGSSLLAGTILAVLFVLMGFEPTSPNKLIHATLGVEQMLTSGGGWQDQVGGLIGGMKLAISRAKIPLVVESFCIKLSDYFLRFLNRRLVLFYTGKVRLARNLLQTVLRNWYAREENVTLSFEELRGLAFAAAEATILEDGTSLGRCVDRYWQLKKVVASGCEPSRVSQCMAMSRTSMLGQSLAGAGGGGYLYGLTTHPHFGMKEALQELFKGMKFSPVEIDTEGLTLTVSGEMVMKAGCEEETELTISRLRSLQREICTG